jgi:hypothetical protein
MRQSWELPLDPAYLLQGLLQVLLLCTLGGHAGCCLNCCW